MKMKLCVLMSTQFFKVCKQLELLMIVATFLQSKNKNHFKRDFKKVTSIVVVGLRNEIKTKQVIL